MRVALRMLLGRESRFRLDMHVNRSVVSMRPMPPYKTVIASYQSSTFEYEKVSARTRKPVRFFK